jgi:hypothetical protein
MATVIVRHKVEDYARWKRGYDDADWLRKQHGTIYASVHREETNPKDTIAVHRFKDIKGADSYGLSQNVNTFRPEIIDKNKIR